MAGPNLLFESPPYPASTDLPEGSFGLGSALRISGNNIPGYWQGTKVRIVSCMGTGSIEFILHQPKVPATMLLLDRGLVGGRQILEPRGEHLDETIPCERRSQLNPKVLIAKTPQEVLEFDAIWDAM